MIIRRDCLLTRSVSTIDETRPNGRKKKKIILYRRVTFLLLHSARSLSLRSGRLAAFPLSSNRGNVTCPPLSSPQSRGEERHLSNATGLLLPSISAPSFPPSLQPRRNVECNSRLAPLAVRERNRSSLAETEPNKRRGFFFFFFFSFDSISSSLLWINRSLEESYKTTRAN